MNEGGLFVVSAADLAPIMDTLLANAGVIVPVGVAVTATMIGIRFIPRLIKGFAKG